MRPTDEIKRLIKNANVTTRPEANERVFEDLAQRLDKQNQIKAAALLPGIGRAIMTNRYAQLAAAALILIAATIAIGTWNEPTNPQTTANNDQANQADVQREQVAAAAIDEQLADIEAMYAAGDAAGLIEMLGSDYYDAQVAAANYLAKLGAVDAIPAMEETAGQYNDSRAEPFIAAADVLAATLVAAGGSDAAPPEPEPRQEAVGASVKIDVIKAIPADALFCIRINKLDYSLMDLDYYLGGISPVPMAASMAVRSKLSQQLNDMSLTHVDTASDFAIFRDGQALDEG